MFFNIIIIKIFWEYHMNNIDHLISSNQFTKEKLVFLLKEIGTNDVNFYKDSLSFKTVFQHKILATLFFEPSTRTRLSFETAFLKSGGKVISVENGFDSSSDKKGETFQDCVKTVSQYADLIVFRHPREYSALEASEVSDCPLINAGDGSGEHPTQSIVDLYTILKEKQTLDGLKIGVYGDLEKARAIHSFVNMIKLFDIEKLDLYDTTKNPKFNCKDYDVVYLTRIQNERHSEKQKSFTGFPFDIKDLKDDAMVLHPLPRNNELPVWFDTDPRAYYFNQVKNGLIVRKVLMEHILV